MGMPFKTQYQNDDNLLSISPDRAESLASEYLTVTGYLLDLFGAVELILDVRRWALNQDAPTPTQKSLILVVISIGSQVDPSLSFSGEAKRFFEGGRQLAY
jgi:hypothetical protein